MTINHGKICYLEIPAVDVAVSSAFYSDVFGWELRQHGDGTTAFDDSNGYVSGMWVLNRAPMTEAGIIISVMVDSVAEASDRVVHYGGTIDRPLDPDSGEKLAWFRDPAGNLMGLYEEPNA